MSYHVGQKIVCIDDTPAAFPHISGEMHGLTKGVIYTVREAGVTGWMDDAPAVRLVEILRPRDDTPFWERRFRPVVERKTDISIFQKMLTPKRKRVLAVNSQERP